MEKVTDTHPKTCEIFSINALHKFITLHDEKKPQLCELFCLNQAIFKEYKFSINKL